MIIKTFPINKKHWTTQWIPISYKNTLSNYQLKKSLTFTWSNKYNLLAICRIYYINKDIIELGDVWLNEECRGKKLNSKKISIIFMEKVIDKIWKIFPNIKIINLFVDKKNISAIKLYEKLKFYYVTSIDRDDLGIKNASMMSRKKIE